MTDVTPFRLEYAVAVLSRIGELVAACMKFRKNIGKKVVEKKNSTFWRQFYVHFYTNKPTVVLRVIKKSTVTLSRVATRECQHALYIVPEILKVTQNHGAFLLAHPPC